jgi:hypothetical protein
MKEKIIFLIFKFYFMAKVDCFTVNSIDFFLFYMTLATSFSIHNMDGFTFLFFRSGRLYTDAGASIAVSTSVVDDWRMSFRNEDLFRVGFFLTALDGHSMRFEFHDCHFRSLTIVF